MKNLLFITWDGPQTSYMEGLFMPIFQEIAKQEAIKFHVIQFTWAKPEKIVVVQKAAKEMGIKYNAFQIMKKPVASLGSLITLFTAFGKIKKYIAENKIDIVMPRSTFPAFMLTRFLKRNFRIIFDADGLPLEERVDFAGLKKDSRQYKWLKSIETKMLRSADAVITRSQKAIDIHVETIGEMHRPKFAVVKNGRDPEFFKSSPDARRNARTQLKVTEEEKLFVYCGSLGNQYCFAEMRAIFEEYQKTLPAKFLILTGNTAFAEKKLAENPNASILIKSVPFQDVPFWLSAADVAFALREPSFSMQGVAPIKLGEYLLMGIPTLASAGIGDTEALLQNFKECYLYDHQNKVEEQLPAILHFIKKGAEGDQATIRNRALSYFSLEVAAESYISALKKFGLL